MLWKQIIVGDQERALITKNGRFGGILAPGEYRLVTKPGVSLDVEKHNVRDLVFQSTWADYLAKERPGLAERHFTRVETNHLQVAMVYVDGMLFQVMLPAKRMLFWRGVSAVTAEVVNVIDAPEVSAQKLPAAERWRRGCAWRKSGKRYRPPNVASGPRCYQFGVKDLNSLISGIQELRSLTSTVPTLLR